MRRNDLAGLAVVVVNYGSSGLIEENLGPLAAAHPELLVVVVDNLSTMAERHSVGALAAARGWTLLESENVGFGAGVNKGVARARELGAARFLLMNPDAVIGGDDVAKLLAVVDQDPMALAAPVIERPDGTIWSAGSDLYLEDGRIRSRRRRLEGAVIQPWLSGACLMVSGVLWDAVGGFDPDYFLYWEDVDFSVRVTLAGGRLRLVADASAVHAEGGTQGVSADSAGSAKSSTYYYFNIRNRLLFAKKHLDADRIESWVAVSRKVAWEVLMQGGRRQLLRSPAPLRAARRALRDGLAALRSPEPLDHPVSLPVPAEAAHGPMILTVCTANVCRSPVAEQVVRAALRGLPGWLGDVRIASAGLRAAPGVAACRVAMAGLAFGANGAHAARALDAALVKEAALVITMEVEQRSAVAALAPGAQPKVFTLPEIASLAQLLAERVAEGSACEPSSLTDYAAALQSLRGLAQPPRRTDADPLTIPDGHDLAAPLHRRTVQDVRAAAELFAEALTLAAQNGGVDRDLAPRVRETDHRR